MSDMCIIPVGQYSRIGNGCWNQVSWPIDGSIGVVSSLTRPRERIELLRFRRRFDRFVGIAILPMVSRISPRVTPRPLRMAGESMNKHDTLFGEHNIGNTDININLLQRRIIRIHEDRKPRRRNDSKRPWAIQSVHGISSRMRKLSTLASSRGLAESLFLMEGWITRKADRLREAEKLSFSVGLNRRKE